MIPKDPDPRDLDKVEKVAQSIANLSDVDWVDLDLDPSGLGGSLENIRKISRVAKSFRKHAEVAPRREVAPPMSLSPSEPERGFRFKSDTDSAPDKWGVLEILSLLGEGNHGSVYSVFDPVLEREVALKVWKNESPKKDRTATLIDEARRLAKVRHPGVVTVHGADTHEGVAGVWTERLEGESAADRLAREGRLSPTEAVRICAQVGSALQAVHTADLVHGDIKDENIYLEPNERVVLIDFGSGRDLEKHSSGTAMSATPLFAAPEVLRGAPSGVSSDLYSLGVVLFRLCTGSFPIRAESFRELLEAHASQGKIEIPESIPDFLSQIVRRSLDPDPAKRYPSAKEMTQGLELAQFVLESHSQAKTNLPQRRSRFFGREKLLLEFRNLLRRERLLTVIGPGGAGKTRFVIEACNDLPLSFADGVWWVDLGSVTAEAGVPLAVLGATGLQIRKRSAEGTLLHGLRTREMLLILDNAEHVSETVRHLGEAILTASPQTRIVVTSRIPLASSGEHVLRVPPLEMPEDRENPSSGADETEPLSDSVHLFIDRAKRKVPEFDSRNWSVELSRICSALEGLPLAVELAAARVGVLSPREIADRIGDPRLLSDKAADRPQHRSVRASVEWSYSLLPDSAQRLLRRLSIFSGGWEREGAQVIAEGEEFGWLEDLATLVDHSLVERTATPNGKLRFGMLVPIREFAEAKLSQSGEAEYAARLHWKFCRQYFRSRLEPMMGPELPATVVELQLEQANLERALSWVESKASEEPDLLSEFAWLVVDLVRFWSAAGAHAQGARWAAAALALLPENADKRLQGWLHLTWARTTISTAFPEAAKQAPKALALLEEVGDDEGVGNAYLSMFSVDIFHQDYDGASRRLDQAESAFIRCGRPELRRRALARRGILAFEQSKPDEAGAVLAEAETLIREVDDTFELGHLLSVRAIVESRRQDFEAACGYFEEALLIYRELSDDLNLTLIHVNLGTCLCQLGKKEAGRVHIELAIQLSTRAGSDSLVAHANMAFAIEIGGESAAERMLEAAAASYREENEPQTLLAIRFFSTEIFKEGVHFRAAVLLRAADRLIAEKDIVFGAKNDPGLVAYRTDVLAKLGEEQYEAAQREGAAWSVGELLAYAQSKAPRP